MVVFEHPITTDIVLMSATYAEDFALVCDQSPAEFGDVKIIVQNHLFRSLFVDIVEVNVLGSPLKVVHKLSRAVGLFQNEGVMQQF